MKRCILFGLLMVMILVLAVGCGKKDEYLEIEVLDISTQGEDQILTLQYKNNTGATVSYGWVNSCKIKVTTDQGAFTCSAPRGGRISQGSSMEALKLRDCPGQVEKIVITELCRLDESGLPAEELHNAVIYNENKGLDTFRDSFGFFDDPSWFHKCIPAMVICIILFSLIKAAGGFLLSGSLPKIHFGGYNDTWHQIDMANQMHREAMATHQREVERQIHQEAADFGMRSVTPIEMGGFVPSPPTFDPPSFF